MPSSGSQHSSSYVFEATRGETPSNPTMKPLRLTGNTLALSKSQLESNEQRPDRHIAAFKLGNNSVAGNFNFELTFETFDDWLEAVMGGSWATKASLTGATYSVANSDSSINDSGDGFVTAGFEAGDVITVAGFTDAANNGTFKISAVTAGKLTLTDGAGGAVSLTNESAGNSVTIATTARVLGAGTTRRFATVERKFADIGQYLRFTGVEADTLSLSIAPNAMITGNFGCVGKGQTTDTAALTGATYELPNSNTPFDSFSGEIQESGSTISVITSMALQVQNGLSSEFVVGSADSIQPSIGKSRVTGNVTAHFEDTTLLNKYINETPTSIVLRLVDVDLNEYLFELPNLRYTTGSVPSEGDGAITIPLDFIGLYDASTETNLKIEKRPAA